jgi:L-lactate dehydrogenase complex protein LldG
MSASRDVILAAIRRQQTAEAPLPELRDGPWITFPDALAHFEKVLDSVGGRAIRSTSIDEVRRELVQLPAYNNAKKIYSLCSGIPSRNVDPDAIRDPHELKDVDFAVLPGELAVAENAAVWISDKNRPHRVIDFIAQHVALIVPATNIVSNMHQAYERLSWGRRGFGCFVSGPSKTADIEQSLVIGAHGARSLTVWFLDDPAS